LKLNSQLQNDEKRHFRAVLSGLTPTKPSFRRPIGQILLYCRIWDKILFESGSDKLQASSYSILDKIGNALASEANLHVMVIGHTDSDGDDAFNQTLSDKRAKALKKYLEEKFNISPGRLMTMGKGESDPVADNASAEGKAQNRRVEFKTL
jgi:OOP family OmpA-OmpF porin